jgi:hypothetical protein
LQQRANGKVLTNDIQRLQRRFSGEGGMADKILTNDIQGLQRRFSGKERVADKSDKRQPTVKIHHKQDKPEMF